VLHLAYRRPDVPERQVVAACRPKNGSRVKRFPRSERSIAPFVSTKQRFVASRILADFADA